MKIFHKYQTLTVFLFFYFIFPSNVVESQSKSLLERAFFYKDIINFGGPFLKTPISSNKIIKQPFNAACSNLNRIILPFYIEENGSGVLTFELYEKTKEQKLVFSTSISVEDFPPSKKIVTQGVDVVLHYIWIPEQPNSRNRKYLWELRGDKFDKRTNLGLYMNNRSHSQIQPVIIDGDVQDTTYVAFYSYCQYRFEWNRIMKDTWNRFKREKMFLLFCLVLVVGIFFGIKLTKTEKA
tara:strand:+ start:10659 stop:11372 length:714 start_codon:yes stop_codon:yes gene_type:complete